jgi:hypothetical protein
MNKDNDNSSKSRKNPSKLPTIQFLKESGIKYLVFLGKCIQYYGIKTVFVFILGVILATIFLYVGNQTRVPFINKFFKVTVTNQAPVLSGVPTTTEYRYVGGEKLMFFAEAHDDDKNLKDTPYSLIDHDGSGMIIDSKSGKVEWSMDFSGTYKITVIAKDKFDAIDYQTFTVTDQKEITIRGCVKTKVGEESKPFINPFEIGVLLGTRRGPFNDTEEADGSFSLEVPFSKKYNIVIWDEEFSNFRYFGDKGVQRVDGKYFFRHALVIFD